MAQKKETPKTTCQICARPTELNRDKTIWRHGYKRPGDGMLTASCYGANYLPYEQSCDLLKKYIGITEHRIEGLESALDRFVAEPPEVIKTTVRRSAWGKEEPVEYVRPVDFDPAAYHNIFHTYGAVYDDRKYRLEQDIKWTKYALEHMKTRLAAWKAPEPASQAQA